MPSRAVAGVRAAALLIRGEAQRITPIDTGNLKASAFTRVVREGNLVRGVVGYQAAYAPFVHEMIDAQFQSPKAEPRFLARAMMRNRSRALALIRGEVRVR